MRSYLDFEKPVAELEAKVEELRALGETGDAVAIGEEIGRLEAKANQALKELYAKRRVGTATFNRVRKILGDAGTVELVGILGYYALVSMILNTFRMPLPQGMKPAFREPA